MEIGLEFGFYERKNKKRGNRIRVIFELKANYLYFISDGVHEL